MKAIRNILIHIYDELDLDIVWDTAVNDIPTIKDRIREIIQLVDE